MTRSTAHDRPTVIAAGRALAFLAVAALVSLAGIGSALAAPSTRTAATQGATPEIGPTTLIQTARDIEAGQAGSLIEPAAGTPMSVQPVAAAAVGVETASVETPSATAAPGVSAEDDHWLKLSTAIEESKQALDTRVAELIDKLDLEATGLKPNTVYGIALGAMAGALVADSLGAGGLATLGLSTASAVAGGYLSGGAVSAPQ